MSNVIESPIPVIDFSSYGLNHKQSEDVSNDDIETIAQEIFEAFSTTGFCYLKNHGLNQKLIDDVLSVSKDFFTLDNETKMKYSRPEKEDSNVLHGFLEVGRENLNPERPVGDLKESFYVHFGTARKWPSEVPHFQNSFTEFNKEATELALRVLDTVSTKLNKQDRNAIRSCHKALTNTESEQCHLVIRTLWYPSTDSRKDIPEGQARCGEHSDYGTLTLLFQKDVGGLEVQNLEGEYVAVPPIPGTVIVNIGDLLQRWSSDKLIAAKHRVRVPADNSPNQKARQAIAVFFGTDMDTKLECLDGSNKYEPISARDYIQQKYEQTFKY